MGFSIAMHDFSVQILTYPQFAIIVPLPGLEIKRQIDFVA